MDQSSPTPPVLSVVAGVLGVMLVLGGLIAALLLPSWYAPVSMLALGGALVRLGGVRLARFYKAKGRISATEPAAPAPGPGGPHFLEIVDVHKSYFLHGKRLDILRGVNVTIGKGELVSLVGASGSGKSTFLHVLGTLDAPAAGVMRFNGRSVFDMNDAEVGEFRNRTIGFVFQSHFLLPEFSAVENVAMPALVARQDRAQAFKRARELLDRVQLSHRADHRPGELSGGESQRVALARALMLQPALLLADEPTGNLDPATGEGIHQLLRDVNRDLGITAVVVTHNEVLARSMPRQLRLKDGRVVPVADS